MAAKLLHSLADENPDLQKQIGCMTGVFHIFDRHHIVPGRRFSGHSPKRLPPGSPNFDNGTSESESSNSYQRPYIMEKHSNNKIVLEKNRASTESSRDSFSSISRSSSFSSLDCNNRTTTHPEPDQIAFPETPTRQHPCGSRQSLDLRDVVKDSMYREPRPFLQTPEHNNNNFQEPNWYFNEPRELSRSKSYQFKDLSSFSVPKDCPRFSYDGRETNRLLFQSRENNSKTANSISKQVEDFPRLSLDSRESSTRSLNTSVSRNPTPSVVAKLMGLESLPDSGSGSGSNSNSGSGNQKDLNLGPIRTSAESSKASDIFGPIKMQTFSRNSVKEPTSPLWKNGEMKPISRFPIEPAPWKQREGGGARSPHRKIQSQYSSVYGEVDKRLKDLQFTQSGKDLRALKQILEAMQSMESRKETQVLVKRNSGSTQNESRRSQGHNRHQNYDSPIVIMKPAKLVERSGGLHVAEFPISIPKSGKHIRKTPPPVSSTKQQNLVTTNSGKIAGPISPRLQQKRAELERRSRPPTPPDSGKSKKQLTRQLSDTTTTSPGGRRRPKYSNIIHDDQYRGQLSQELVNSPEFSQQIDNLQSPSSLQEKSSLIEESHDPEYPSPVSVLDDAVYMDHDSPSPVKHIPKLIKDEATEGLNRTQWEKTADNNTLPDTTKMTSEINRKKLQNIEHLVQKLTRLNSNHDESHTDYIASLCENTKKPDDRYISEILLASGLLLRDLKTFQFHSSGHPINPELFLVLEQTKFSNSQKDDSTPEKFLKKEKFHRKLIFDTVNEVLTGKLLVGPSVSFKVVKKKNKSLNGQKLLRDLCMEIEELQVRKKNKDSEEEEEEDDDGFKSILWEEVLNKTESWTDYDGELPGICLEVERLIFKDLVNEVVLGEAADGKRVVIKGGRRCRQLFSK